MVAAVFGILLGAPTLRLRGDYLAIVTLGFGEIVPIVFLNSSTYTEGPNGIGGISPPSIGDFVFPTVGNPWPFYLTMLLLITVSMILIYRLQESRLGRAWMAIREDELAAAANGVNTVTTKLLAFALGASTAGLAGVFASSKLTLVEPEPVPVRRLVHRARDGRPGRHGQHLGRGSSGPSYVFLIQTVILKQLNIFFDNVHVPFLLDIDFLQNQFLLYGIALVAMMLIGPEGLFPSRRGADRSCTAEEDTDFGIEQRR